MACSLVLDTQARVSAHLRAPEDIELTVPDFDVPNQALFDDQRPLAAADDHQGESRDVKL